MGQCIIVVKGKRCPRDTVAHDWCAKHYMRWWRHGDPTNTLQVSPDTPLRERLEARTIQSDDCWEWISTLSSAGYGQTWWQGKYRMAHRLWYEELRAPIPDGLELDHLCHNLRCVNPWHLEPVTHQENMRRAWGGHCSGCQCKPLEVHGGDYPKAA